MARLSTIALVASALSGIFGTVSAATTSSVKFKPTAGASWNIQLSPLPKIGEAKGYHVWDFDMGDASKSLVESFKAKGHPVICYFSAGTVESYRADANEFPKKAIGKVDDGWPQEHWLNTSNTKVREIMMQRMDAAARKGCDGIDPDNIDGYDNDTGFDLTKDDAVNYLEFLSSYAHSKGMAFGLKNGNAIVDRVIDFSEWAIVEQCVKYDECKPFDAFIKQGKPVFQIEYSTVKKGCNGPNTKGFSTLIKKLSLNSWTRTCPP